MNAKLPIVETILLVYPVRVPLISCINFSVDSGATGKALTIDIMPCRLLVFVFMFI